MDSEGGRLKGMRFSVGSGSPYAYGVLDNGYSFFSLFFHRHCSINKCKYYDVKVIMVSSL